MNELQITQQALDLRNRQYDSLEKRLKEAEEVIAFYADRSNWRRDHELDSSISEMKYYPSIDYRDLEDNDWQNAQHGGSLAREHQKKFF